MGASKLEGYDTELIVQGRKLFALGHHARLLIIQIINEYGECNLDQIEEQMVIGKSTIKEHVDKLREEGIVEGNWTGPEFLLSLNIMELENTKEQICQFVDSLSKS